MRIRTSPSDLEAVRYYHRVDDPDLDQLLARLRRQQEPNEAMLAGTALHKCLETMPLIEGDVPMVTTDGYAFVFDTDQEIFLPPAREVKAEKVYQIGDCEVTLACVADVVDAITVTDHKLSKKFDPEAYYLDSLQWRCYLDVFACKRFVYNVFVGQKDRIPDHEGRGVYRIKSVERFEIYWYSDLTRDIEAALTEFVELAKVHLPERVEE